MLSLRHGSHTHSGDACLTCRLLCSGMSCDGTLRSRLDSHDFCFWGCQVFRVLLLVMEPLAFPAIYMLANSLVTAGIFAPTIWITFGISLVNVSTTLRCEGLLLLRATNHSKVLLLVAQPILTGSTIFISSSSNETPRLISFTHRVEPN